MKSIVTLVAVAFTAMVSSTVQANGNSYPGTAPSQRGSAALPESGSATGDQPPLVPQREMQRESISGGATGGGQPPLVPQRETQRETTSGGSGGRDADNTGRNQQRESGRLEAQDQSNASGDLELTARLRRAITDDGSMSVNARNIKIITQGGRVTLRGPVNSEEEKRRIETLARQIAGSQVTSELEVRRER